MKPVARTALVMILVTAPIAIAACQASSPGPASIVFEIRFVPNRIDAVAGEPVRVTLTNKGLQRHDLNFPSLHMPGLEGVEAILEPGETRMITLRFDQAGTHTFQCSLPGHAVAGMTGAVFVRP
jgi:uncharacterized cupredoxin-like copper-binding protein